MTTHRMRRAGTALAILTTLAAPLAAAVPAQASGGGDAVEARGWCGLNTQWKLKAKHDDGRVEVEFEVDSNRVGQVWSVRLRDNGVLVFSGTRTTQAPSGSFELHRYVRDRAGADVIRARAVRGSQVCGGSVTV